jgi:hypothetical protein
MAKYVGRQGFLGALEGDIARLESLLIDLKRIADGSGPTPDDLASAPLLDQYVVSMRSAPCLIGRPSGHPILRGDVIATSELWAMAPERGWARTLSRFYRLGRPFGRGDDG